MGRDLTKRQAEVLGFIRDFIRKQSYPPTVREIADHFGLRGPGGVQKHLHLLEKKGRIRRSSRASRAIEILGEKKLESRSVPILGRIPAGPLDLAIEEREGEMILDATLARGEGLFLLKVVGESMIGAHILNGDYALIRRQPTVENGEIAAVRVGETATLKRFYREGDVLRLQPENPTMDPIRIRAGGEGDMAVLGKVIAVIRPAPGEKR